MYGLVKGPPGACADEGVPPVLRNIAINHIISTL